MNAKERQAKVTEKLINMAMGISPDTPEQQQQQCGPQQSMEDRISEKFLETAIGDVDLSPEKVEKARELTGESIAK